ncbi:MAG: hypothetical protein AAGG51_09925 [Cyanobacteria bacterium P01_G01_bin.54]
MIVLCPGMHTPEVSESFRTRFTPLHSHLHCFIPEAIAPYDGSAICQHVQNHCESNTPLVLMGFSAGAVGARYAAQALHHQGWAIAALWLWDGWGVPRLGEPFPTVRLSHDTFTHWSSALLGEGDDSFWADPAVPHLDLWRNPEQIRGWRSLGSGLQERISLLEFAADVLS